MGYSSKILNNSVGALLAQQAVIATTSNNIANVNTPGYARRTVDLQTRSGAVGGNDAQVGSGVQVGQIQRSVDEFINKLLREAAGESAAAGIENQFTDRLQSAFALDESGTTIGSALTDFYNAVQDLSSNPASIEFRANLIERGRDLVDTLKNTYSLVAELQGEADKRIETELDTVNSLAAEIAALNGQISTRESGERVAADERDQRDILLKKLSEKISYTMIEDSDGAANIYLAKGFALVSGATARTLEFTDAPSFASGPLPPSLGGAVLRHIVFDYNSGAGTAHIDLTQPLQGGEGTIGALLKLRGYNDPAATSAFSADGTLVGVAARIEAISRNLLVNVNQTYLGAADENAGLAGFQASSGDLNGNTPAVFGLFDFTYGGSKDADADGLPSLADLIAAGIDNFTSVLSFGVSDPRAIAAAYDANSTAGATTFPPGDGQNMEALAATLQATNLTFAVGSAAFTGSFDGAYEEAVTHVGILKHRATTNESVANANLLAMETRRDSISAVSLDEEFTSLIKFQKAFQASARMIKIADGLLEQIVGLI